MEALMKPIAVCRCEAARLTGLSQSTIDRLIRNGHLPVRHVNRAVRIPTAALERLVGEELDLAPEPDVDRRHDDGGIPRPCNLPAEARP